MNMEKPQNMASCERNTLCWEKSMYTITFNSHSFPLSNYHFQSAVISPCSYASFYSFRDIFLIFFFLPWHKMDWDSCSCQSSKMDFFKNGSIGILNKISCIQICLKKCHIYLHTFGMLVIWISLKGISWELLEQMCINLPLSLTLKSSTPITFVQGKTKNNVHV